MLLKSIFSRKEEKKNEEKKEIVLDNIEEWLINDNKDFIEGLEKNIEESYGKVDEKLSDLRESNNIFKRAQIHPDVHKKLKKAAETNKSDIEKSIDDFIGSFSIPKEKDFGTALQFCETVSKKMGELGKKNQKAFIIVNEALRKDTKNIRKSLGSFEEEVLQLWETLKEEHEKVSNIEEVKNLSKELKEKIDREPKIDKEIKSLESALGFQEQKIHRAKKDLEEIKNGKEMSKLSKKKKEIENFKEKRKKLEERLINEMAMFEKAFKKIKYYRGDSKSNPIKGYLESPVDTLAQKNGLKKFKDFIGYIKNDIEENSFKLSDKTRKKALTGVERVESGVLDWTLNEYNELSDKIEKLSDSIDKSKVLVNQKEKKEEYNDWHNSYKTTKNKIKNLKKEKKNIRRIIKNKKRLLENKIKKLSDYNAKVVI